MYSGGVQAIVQSRDGSDVSAIKTTIDEAASTVHVEVGAGVAAGAPFEIVISPK